VSFSGEHTKGMAPPGQGKERAKEKKGGVVTGGESKTGRVKPRAPLRLQEKGVISVQAPIMAKKKYIREVKEGILEKKGGWKPFVSVPSCIFFKVFLQRENSGKLVGCHTQSAGYEGSENRSRLRQYRKGEKLPHGKAEKSGTENGEERLRGRPRRVLHSAARRRGHPQQERGCQMVGTVWRRGEKRRDRVMEKKRKPLLNRS